MMIMKLLAAANNDGDYDEDDDDDYDDRCRNDDREKQESVKDHIFCKCYFPYWIP